MRNNRNSPVTVLGTGADSSIGPSNANPHQAGQTLPRVAGSVNPDFTGIENQYASGYDIHSVIQSLPGKFSQCLRLVEKEIQYCKNNLRTVAQHEEEINSDDAREHYFHAESDLAAQYEHYLSLRKDICEQIKEIDRSIQGTLIELGGFVDSTPSLEPPSPPSESPPPASITAPREPSKEIDTLSDAAMRNHVAATFGIDPSIMDKKEKS